jgi:hypothetical protein
MGRPLKIKKSTTNGIGFNAFDQLTNPAVSTGLSAEDHLGVVGGVKTGVATAGYPVIKCRVKIGSNAEADGFILRQKGSIKYLVSDGTNTGTCVVVHKPDGTLAADEMNIYLEVDDSSSILISRLTNKFAIDFSDPPDRYVLNFFSDAGTQIKSGAADNATLPVGLVENYTS